MEVTKLYNVILDLINEEKADILTTNLNSLVTSITSNQAVAIKETLTKIHEGTSNSVTNTYSVSNLNILKALKGETYFGDIGYKTIDDILTKNSYNISQTTTELQTYINTRAEFIAIITTLKDSFKKLGFEPHYYNDETYEIGLLLPVAVTDNKVASVTKELQQWNTIIKTFKELTGQGVEDAKITLVNNGSLEFFFTDTHAIALCISVIIERTCALYKKILEIREVRERLKQLGGPKQEQTDIAKFEKETIDKEIELISADIFSKYVNQKIEKGRLNELKIAVNGHIRYVAKAIDKGIVIEINTPDIDEPEILDEPDTDENKKEKAKAEKDHKEKIAKLDTIKKSVQVVKEVAGLGGDVFKYLTTGNTDKESEDKKK